MPVPLNLFWFRRDLRLHDNAGLYHALKSGKPVQPVFIFDRNILDQLEDRQDARVSFIHEQILILQKQLKQLGATLDVRYGKPEAIFLQLIEDYNVEAVYCNHDYEPYARKRDHVVGDILKTNGIQFYSYKDQVIFEKSEVIKDNGEPYTVFTPYSRKWKSKLSTFYLREYPVEKYNNAFFKQSAKAIPTLASMQFVEHEKIFPSKKWDVDAIKDYKDRRDFPAENGTSRLSVHLRFGSISIRQLVRETSVQSETFLTELIWREFYQAILWHFPHVVNQSFKPAYDVIKWRNNEAEFEAWCDGKTGYPIVDAGMRELNNTGYMHNRVRMIVASFLTKHLLIDWRWGEAYFASKLLDYDLAANNGGWQWAAGSGCDAAPYFRIFNPALQTKKFDPQLQYIRKWVPELNELHYPQPILNHELARKRCLETYGAALKKETAFIAPKS